MLRLNQVLKRFFFYFDPFIRTLSLDPFCRTTNVNSKEKKKSMPTIFNRRIHSEPTHSHTMIQGRRSFNEEKKLNEINCIQLKFKCAFFYISVRFFFFFFFFKIFELLLRLHKNYQTQMSHFFQCARAHTQCALYSRKNY